MAEKVVELQVAPGSEAVFECGCIIRNNVEFFSLIYCPECRPDKPVEIRVVP